MQMPFGKYEGREITDVPKGYLRWLENNVPIQGNLGEEVYAVLRGLPTPPKRPAKDIDDVVQSIDVQLKAM